MMKIMPKQGAKDMTGDMQKMMDENMTPEMKKLMDEIKKKMK